MNTITQETRQESNRKVDRQYLYKSIKDVLSTGDYTAREVAGILFSNGLIKFGGRQATAPRLTELVKLGDVKVVGKKQDELTKTSVAVYGLVVHNG